MRERPEKPIFEGLQLGLSFEVGDILVVLRVSDAFR